MATPITEATGGTGGHGDDLNMILPAIKSALTAIPDLQFEVFGPDGELVIRADESSIGRADSVAGFLAAETGTHHLALRYTQNKKRWQYMGSRARTCC